MVDKRIITFVGDWPIRFGVCVFLMISSGSREAKVRANCEGSQGLWCRDCGVVVAYSYQYLRDQLETAHQKITLVFVA
jgi:hypothetical protein